jgi:Domain of unknown function (DUF4288)
VRGGCEEEKEVTRRPILVTNSSLGGKSQMHKKKTTWFWAWIVLGTIRKAEINKPMARCEVWENLIIISAPNPRKAFLKAKRIGKQSAGDSRGTLRFFGKPAKQMFLGIQSIGVIHEELKDGAEITWNLKRLTFVKAKKLVRSKINLLRELSKEFNCVK